MKKQVSLFIFLLISAFGRCQVENTISNPVITGDAMVYAGTYHYYHLNAIPDTNAIDSIHWVKKDGWSAEIIKLGGPKVDSVQIHFHGSSIGYLYAEGYKHDTLKWTSDTKDIIVKPNKLYISGQNQVKVPCKYKYVVDTVSATDTVLWEKTLGWCQDFSKDPTQNNAAWLTIDDPPIGVPTWIKASILEGNTDTIWSSGNIPIIVKINIQAPQPDGPSYICPGKEGSYSVDIVPDASMYVWSRFPEGITTITSGQYTPTVTLKVDSLATGGGYVQVYVIDNDGCNSPVSDPTQFTIYQLLTPSIDSVINKNTSKQPETEVCVGEQIILKAIYSDCGQNPKFYWLLNNDPTPVDSGQNYIPNFQSNIQDNLKITCHVYPDWTGLCFKKPYAEYDLTFTIYAKPEKGQIINDYDTVICQSDSLNLSWQKGPGNPGNLKYWQRIDLLNGTWSGPIHYADTTITEKNLSVGLWQYKAIISNGDACDSVEQFSKRYQVYAGPQIANFDAAIVEKGGQNYHAPDSVFLICSECYVADTGVSNYTYHWYYIRNDSIFTPPAGMDGNQFCIWPRYLDACYYLDISSKSPEKCTISTKCHKCSMIGGKSSSVRIYPNPNNGIFTLELNSNEYGTATIRIFNLVGMVQRRFSADKKEPTVKIPVDFSSYNKGIYLIEATLGNGERLIEKVLVY